MKTFCQTIVLGTKTVVASKSSRARVNFVSIFDLTQIHCDCVRIYKKKNISS